MSAWPPFQDPLDKLFDWPRRSRRQDDVWFKHLLRDNTRMYYAVENESHILIGRISLREIQGRESARLGIGFGRAFVGQGYGTEALRVFLRHYFVDLGFERMVLDVAAINRRATRSYERCGFQCVGSHYRYAGTDGELTFLSQNQYRDLRGFLKREAQQNVMLFYDMALDQGDWLRQQEEEL